MSGYKKILVVYKKSALELAQENNNTQLLDLVAKNDPSVQHYKEAHESNEKTINALRDGLGNGGLSKSFFFKKVDFVHRADIRSIKKGQYDLVISVGGDGTFLWTSKILDWQIPILGINSDPKRSVGFYTCTDIGGLDRVIHDLRELWWGQETRIERLQVSVNGKVVQKRILNDILFSAAHPAAMTKYTLTVPERNGEYTTEEQRSSGIWISTAGGSTGANLSAGGWILPVEDKRAQFVVREPMKNFVWGEEHKILHGFFTNRFYDKSVQKHIQQKMTIVCKTRDAILACDGDTITIPVTIGDVIEITHDENYLTVLGMNK
jgi:NAD+ kinase